jgi:hypothetical protein
MIESMGQLRKEIPEKQVFLFRQSAFPPTERRIGGAGKNVLDIARRTM